MCRKELALYYYIDCFPLKNFVFASNFSVLPTIFPFWQLILLANEIHPPYHLHQSRLLSKCKCPVFPCQPEWKDTPENNKIFKGTIVHLSKYQKKRI